MKMFLTHLLIGAAVFVLAAVVFPEPHTIVRLTEGTLIRRINSADDIDRVFILGSDGVGRRTEDQYGPEEAHAYEMSSVPAPVWPIAALMHIGVYRYRLDSIHDVDATHHNVWFRPHLDPRRLVLFAFGCGLLWWLAALACKAITGQYAVQMRSPVRDGC